MIVPELPAGNWPHVNFIYIAMRLGICPVHSVLPQGCAVSPMSALYVLNIGGNLRLYEQGIGEECSHVVIGKERCHSCRSNSVYAHLITAVQAVYRLSKMRISTARKRRTVDTPLPSQNPPLLSSPLSYHPLLLSSLVLNEFVWLGSLVLTGSSKNVRSIFFFKYNKFQKSPRP